MNRLWLGWEAGLTITGKNGIFWLNAVYEEKYRNSRKGLMGRRKQIHMLWAMALSATTQPGVTKHLLCSISIFLQKPFLLLS